MLSRQDWERARVVDEDLDYLINEWYPQLDDRALRRDSPLLRKLLVDGQYARAWRDLDLPGEPYISGSVLDDWLGDTTREYVQFAVTPPGGTLSSLLASMGGDVQMGVMQDVQIGSVVGVVGAYGHSAGLLLLAIPPNAVAASNRTGGQLTTEHLKPGRRHEIGLPLSRYLESSFALLLGTEITRREVIQYVAHKLGGAHFDPTRNRRNDERLELLDQLARTELGLLNRRPINAVYIELQSIAEALAASGDAARFRAAFARVPEPSQ